MPQFNRWDICLAYYWYATLYHGGQFTRVYKYFGRLNKIGFKPGAFFGVQGMNENAKAIFDDLVLRGVS